MFGHRIFVPLKHDFFNEITTLFVNLASFNAATESFWNLGSKPALIPMDKEHRIYLYGRVANLSFPIHDLMHIVVRNGWPVELSATLHPATTSLSTIPNSVQLQSDPIVSLIVQLVGTMFLKFYERNAHRARKAFGSDQKAWPEIWRLAWLLRNAIAHGDRWAINDPKFPDTSWYGVRITSADSGKPWYSTKEFIGGGDVILLMEEMSTV